MGIIHRDLKLENVIWDNEKVKIIDLGCSNYFGENIVRETQIGTRPYNSPELLQRDRQDDRLDVWTLGVMIFEMLFLQLPFQGSKKNEMEEHIKVREGVFRNSSTHCPKAIRSTRNWRICSVGYSSRGTSG